MERKDKKRAGERIQRRRENSEQKRRRDKKKRMDRFTFSLSKRLSTTMWFFSWRSSSLVILSSEAMTFSFSFFFFVFSD